MENEFDKVLNEIPPENDEKRKKKEKLEKIYGVKGKLADYLTSDRATRLKKLKIENN